MEIKLIHEKKLGEIKEKFNFFLNSFVIYIYIMAKRGFVKSIQKTSPFKKLSATFISLAFLFVISIVLHFVFNKYSVENFVEGNGTKKQQK